MITELASYASGDFTGGQAPADSSVLHTVEYLKACSYLFEEGILSHEKIQDPTQSSAFGNIERGYRYVTAWADSLLGIYTS